MKWNRFAVYYTPQPGALAEFGAAWLGWDLAAGKAVAHPPLVNLPLPAAKITATPRKYGFHATIKPPFRLADGHSLTALQQSLEILCKGLSPVQTEGLSLTQLGRFLALTVQNPPPALQARAGRTVKDLDRFRAPASVEELTRRRLSNLSARQDALLVDWGYPYVLNEFRFHITLTGKLSTDNAICGPIRAATGPERVEISRFALRL